ELLGGAENLAYIIYTSGSTGQPKGAMNTHRGIVNRLLWMQATYGLNEQDRVLQKTPFSFDVSVWEFFWPLLTGARLVLARPGGHRDGQYLRELIIKEQITTLHFVPSMLRVFLEEEGLEDCRTLRRVISSGEELPAEVAARCFSRLANAELHNLYGPTEAAVDVTWWECERGWEGSVPIGRPIWNTQVYVLDGAQRPVPQGVLGELYLGGVGVGRGYWQRAELTAEKFVPDPYGGERGARLYRTGDVVRQVGAGVLEYVGRADYQVKVRGNRIELGEVEARLAQHSGVRESVVVVRDDEQHGAHLVAYVVAAPDESVSASQLREHLRRELPEYMIPGQFVMLDQLPLTSNGKINRRALPEARSVEREAWVAARTPIEETLADIWSKVLGVEQIGVKDNFFELGGDSILSIQIVSKAKQAGLEFEPKQLFQHQTVAELATIVKIRTAIEEEQSIIEGPVPLTPIQHLFFERNFTDLHQLNQSLMLEVRGTPEPEQLRQAIEHLYLHHDALRLRFELNEAGWQQFNEGAAPREIFSCVNISNLPEDAQTTSMSETVAAVQSGLDLSSSPLLKAVLFERGAGRAARLLLVVHYLVADSVSWRILLEDLQKVYTQLNRGEELLLGPKTTSFKQWAEKLVEHAGSIIVESSYWLNALSRKVARLPFDYQDDNETTSPQSVLVKLDPEETNALLEQVLPAYRVQMDEVLLTAAAQSFKSWTGQPLLVDLEVHGREDLLLELNLTRTVGCLSSVYPVLLDVDDEATPGEALNSIKKQLRDIPGKGIGYGLLRYLSENGVAARLQELPAAEVRVNCFGQLSQILTDLPMFELANEFAELNHSAQGRRGYSIEINGGIFDGQLQITWTYSEGLHRRSTIEKLAESFIEALRSLIEHCEAEEGAEVIPSDFPLARLDQHKLSKLARMISLEDESDPWTA
ncbi:MAG TPA: amino acid adenylation domain-containing protein, partial [Pyrinomonadaceae bacterium]|nr:amino acid adenylation domain-containing protein [Pyrinomonadaceae bacterium]